MTQSTFPRTTAKEINQPAEQAEEEKCNFIFVSHFHNKELFSVIRIWFNSHEYRTIYSSPQVFMPLFQKRTFFLPTYDAPDVRLEDAQNAVCKSVNLRPVLLLIIRQAPICA